MVAIKYSIWFVLLFVGLNAAAAPSDRAWSLYKSRYAKNYPDPAEDAARRDIYLNSKRAVEKHNAQFGSSVSFEKELNEFADWTKDELASLASDSPLTREQLEEMEQNTLNASEPLGKWLLADDGPIPDEVDWRKVPGRVSEVKSLPHLCFASWAIVAAGVLEGQQANLNISKLIPLSAQNILDCSGSNHGCKGGDVNKALKDLAGEQGVDDEASYPWDGFQSDCRYKPEKSVMSVSGFKLLAKDENVIKRVVAKFGPVAASMDGGSQLPDYKSGIYADDPYCMQDPWRTRYSVLIVGYGRDKKRGDYWIIKNNWGKNWGEQGYFRMIMHKNMCGIAFAATIPTF